MAKFTRERLSGTTSGRALLLTTSNFTIHTTPAGSGSWDEVYLWVSNASGVARTVTIDFGGVSGANPDYRVCNGVEIPANSPPIPMLTGQSMQAGLSVYILASANNSLVVTGYVNRIEN